MKNSPTMPMTARGTNFRTVVTTCVMPVSRVPRMLMAVMNQITPMPARAASRLWSPRSPQNTAA
jgi:hypothetical protein